MNVCNASTNAKTTNIN